MSTAKICEAADQLSHALDRLKHNLNSCSQELEDELCPCQPRASDDPSPLNVMRMSVAHVAQTIDEVLAAYDRLRESVLLTPRYELFFDYLDAPKTTTAKIRRLLWGLEDARC
jgi:hypothetical protein